MKKRILLIILIEVIVMALYYYIMLPPINLTSMEFWQFIIFGLAIFVGLNILSTITNGVRKIINGRNLRNQPKLISIPILTIIVIIIGIFLVNFLVSPLFNAKSYSKRISVDETGNFTNDI